MVRTCLLTIALAAAAIAATAQQDRTTTPVVNVVLVGALGDLSKKYLIQALSRVDTLRFQNPPQPELILWPGSRSNTDKGRLAMEVILNEHLTCQQGTDYQLAGEAHECVSNQKAFKSRVMPYRQLKHDQDYHGLNAAIEAHNKHNNYQEMGRLMYLSIPPKAYRNVSKSIARHARPKSATTTRSSSTDPTKPWLRVVFEKPFGSDVQSAIELADTLGESLEEEEIYRIDHYLGKAGVRIIHAFRAQNKDIYEALLTTEHVAYVDVVMKEQTDCAGRAGYYDDYGVVRDLHQNHLSEMMALALMDLPLDTQVLEDSTKTVQQQQSQLMAMYKAYCYDAIQKPSLAQDVVVGQYEGYQKHVEQDRAKWMTDPNDIKQRTVTPTFASVRLRVDNHRWRDTPVYLTSGKALEEREAYVRFVFKNGEELLFNVQGGGKGTHVHATRGLPAFRVPDGWRKSSAGDASSAPGTARTIVPNKNPGAYDHLVSKVWEGDQSHFVATDTLLASWRLWTPLLQALDTQPEPPPLYTQGGGEMYAASLELFENTVVGRLKWMDDESGEDVVVQQVEEL